MKMPAAAPTVVPNPAYFRRTRLLWMLLIGFGLAFYTVSDEGERGYLEGKQRWLNGAERGAQVPVVPALRGTGPIYSLLGGLFLS